MHWLKLPRVLLAAVLVLTALLPVARAADVAVPPLKTRVTDLTATLSAEQTAALESKLAAFEQRKGSQIAVLLVPATQPETIEQYGIRVAGQWKLGRKGVDDGAILLIAKDERKLRIEVGRGLEGALPDAIAKRIVADDIVPLFKQGDINAGVNAGVDRIIKVIDGEPLPDVKGSGWSVDNADDMPGWAGLLVVFLGGLLRWMFGAFFGALITGGITAGVALFLGVETAVALIVGGIVALLCLIGFSMLGGGGLGGGSWGGGGGDFGGGGASGSW
jgi:uncharacterized protein